MSREYEIETLEEQALRECREHYHNVISEQELEIGRLRKRIKELEATKAKKTRRQTEDFYPTPAWSTQGLIKKVKAIRQLATKEDHWLEPAAGEGAIAQAVEAMGLHPRWCLLDVRRECQQPLEALQLSPAPLIETGMIFQLWQPPSNFSVCITNPPYARKQPEEFVRRATQFSKIVALLLRLNWGGSSGRAKFFKDYPCDCYPISPRPFPDMTEYAWFVWGDGPGGRYQRIDCEV